MTDTVLIKPKITDSAESYWAMFYCAILNTLVNQKNIKYRFKGHSLQNYKGVLQHPSNFFNQMKSGIINHGLEYLMIDFLKSKDGKDVRDELFSTLLRQYGINDFHYSHMNIFKLGEDSEIHDVIVKYNDPSIKIFAPHNKNYTFRKKRIGFTYDLSNVAKSFIHSDLLIMVSNGKNHTYGFVGEVEGGHGEKIFLDSYWAKNDSIKSRYTSFAIGASDKKKSIDQITPKGNIILTRDQKERWLLHFSNSHYFIKSFGHAIKNIELCLGGHFSNIDGLDDSH